MIVNYNRKIFIVQATGLLFVERVWKISYSSLSLTVALLENYKLDLIVELVSNEGERLKRSTQGRRDDWPH